jgi:hypothetical protein
MTSPTTLNNKHGVLPERPVGGDVPIARAPRYLRIPALDFTKGALVLIMVLYHWLNYFISPQGFIYRYLRFLTPSFIFISGFLISHVYFVTYGISDPQVPRRLMKRGLKILAVFIFLNVVRIFLIPDSRNGVMPSEPWAAKNIIAVYVTGNMSVGGVKAAAFPILVPIWNFSRSDCWASFLDSSLSKPSTIWWFTEGQLLPRISATSPQYPSGMSFIQSNSWVYASTSWSFMPWVQTVNKVELAGILSFLASTLCSDISPRLLSFKHSIEVCASSIRASPNWSYLSSQPSPLQSLAWKYWIAQEEGQ